MKWRTISVLLILIGVIAVFRYCNDKPEEGEQANIEPLTISQNSDPFNRSFKALLDSYYLLKGALVESDTSKANAASRSIAQNAANLRVGEIRGDTSGMIRETAGFFATSIGASAEALQAEKDLESKRKEFEIITDALWSLTRTVRYDGEKVYYQYCPMAFDDKGAYWMSNERTIRNPYFGDKMLSCGQLADSLDYSKR